MARQQRRGPAPPGVYAREQQGPGNVAPIERPLVDHSDPFNTVVIVTMDLNNTLLHNVPDGRSSSKPIIRYDHLAPVNDILDANADIRVCSFVGFEEYDHQAEEGGICHRSRLTLEHWLRQHRVARQREPAAHRGAFVNLTYVNRKLGRPEWNYKRQTEDTGGKDWFCRVHRSPILMDDHDGICAGAADCGVTPVLVASDRHPQQMAGVSSFRGFTAACRHVVSMLRNRDQRARLIAASSHIQVPRPRARERFDFANLEHALGHITSTDFIPKTDAARPLGAHDGPQP